MVRHRLASIALAVATGLVPHAARSQGAGVMSLAIPDAVSLHEPVVIDVTVKNDFSDPLEVDLGLSFARNFEFQLTRPDGSQTTVRPLGRDGWQPGGELTIPPGTSKSEWVVLDEWTQLLQVGHYDMTIRFTGAARRPGGAVMGLSRNFSKSFDIRPR